MIFQHVDTQTCYLQIINFFLGRTDEDSLVKVINKLNNQSIFSTTEFGATLLENVLYFAKTTPNVSLNKCVTVVQHLLAKAKKISNNAVWFLLAQPSKNGISPLHQIMTSEELDFLQLYFKEARAVIDLQSEDGRKTYLSLFTQANALGSGPLFQATKTNNLAKLKIYLDEIKSVFDVQTDSGKKQYCKLLTSKSHDGLTILCNVLMFGNSEYVQYYLDELKEAFDWRTKRGRERYSNFLMGVNKTGFTPLLSLVRNNNLANLQRYLQEIRSTLNLQTESDRKKYSDFLLRENEAGFTTLANLLRSNDLEKLQFYLNEVKDAVDWQSQQGRERYSNFLMGENKAGFTPLLSLSREKNLANLQFYLQEVKSTLNLQTESDRRKYFNFLLQKNEAGFTALLNLLCSGDLKNLQFYLNEVKDAVDWQSPGEMKQYSNFLLSTNGLKYTPLEQAVYSGSPSIVSCLLAELKNLPLDDYKKVFFSKGQERSMIFAQGKDENSIKINALIKKAREELQAREKLLDQRQSVIQPPLFENKKSISKVSLADKSLTSSMEVEQTPISKTVQSPSPKQMNDDKKVSFYQKPSMIFAHEEKNSIKINELITETREELLNQRQSASLSKNTKSISEASSVKVEQTPISTTVQPLSLTQMNEAFVPKALSFETPSELLPLSSSMDIEHAPTKTLIKPVCPRERLSLSSIEGADWISAFPLVQTQVSLSSFIQPTYFLFMLPAIPGDGYQSAIKIIETLSTRAPQADKVVLLMGLNSRSGTEDASKLKKYSEDLNKAFSQRTDLSNVTLVMDVFVWDVQSLNEVESKNQVPYGAIRNRLFVRAVEWMKSMEETITSESVILSMLDADMELHEKTFELLKSTPHSCGSLGFRYSQSLLNQLTSDKFHRQLIQWGDRIDRMLRTNETLASVVYLPEPSFFMKKEALKDVLDECANTLHHSQFDFPCDKGSLEVRGLVRFLESKGHKPSFIKPNSELAVPKTHKLPGGNEEKYRNSPSTWPQIKTTLFHLHYSNAHARNFFQELSSRLKCRDLIHTLYKLGSWIALPNLLEYYIKERKEWIKEVMDSLRLECGLSPQVERKSFALTEEARFALRSIAAKFNEFYLQRTEGPLEKEKLLTFCEQWALQLDDAFIACTKGSNDLDARFAKRLRIILITIEQCPIPGEKKAIQSNSCPTLSSSRFYQPRADVSSEKDLKVSMQCQQPQSNASSSLLVKRKQEPLQDPRKYRPYQLKECEFYRKEHERKVSQEQLQSEDIRVFYLAERTAEYKNDDDFKCYVLDKISRDLAPTKRNGVLYVEDTSRLFVWKNGKLVVDDDRSLFWFKFKQKSKMLKTLQGYKVKPAFEGSDIGEYIMKTDERWDLFQQVKPNLERCHSVLVPVAQSIVTHKSVTFFSELNDKTCLPSIPQIPQNKRSNKH